MLYPKLAQEGKRQLSLDSFCSSHIVRLFLKLCEDSCIGSRCQIVSDSNCVLLYMDAWRTRSSLPVWSLHACHSPRSSDRSLSIPRTKTKTIGPCGFYFASFAAWNALQVHLCDPELSLNRFKTKLKTHFFPDPPPWLHLSFNFFCTPTWR